MKLKSWIGVFFVFAFSFATLGGLETYGEASVTPAPLPVSKVTFDRFEANTLFFKNENGAAPKPVKTQLAEVLYLGTLNPPKGGLPYFLFSARSCQECLEDKAIYAIQPTSEGKPTSFVYPGKILDPKDKELLLEARAFYGKCLPHKGDVYVVYQKEKVDRRHQMQPSVFVAEPTENSLEEKLIERHFPKLPTTLQLVKKKSCVEISGRNRVMLSKPLNLTPRSLASDSEDDDTDPSKNKQSE